MSEEPQPRVSTLQLITWHLDTWQPEPIEAFSALSGVLWGSWTWFSHAFQHNPPRYAAMLQLADSFQIPAEAAWSAVVVVTGLLQMVALYGWSRGSLLRTPRVNHWFRFRRAVVLLQVVMWSFLLVMFCQGDWRYGSTALYVVLAGSQIWAYYRTAQDRPA